MAALSGAALRAPGRSSRALRIAYTASIALLALLALATLASPLLLPMLRRETAPLSDAGKLQVLARDDSWVLQYNLTNRSADAGAYTFEVASLGAAGAGPPAPERVLHTSSVLVDAGRTYVFIYHLRPHQLPDGPARFRLHRGGDAMPVEDVTLHLSAAGGSR